MPGAQNVETNFTRLVTGEARLHYTDVKRSIGAVDDEKGITWELDYLGSRVNGQVTPQVRGGLDLGFALPLANSSIWLRTAAGFANGDRNSTVANFYFGGFGNNYVDDKSVKRYREYSSFPGFEIDEISALSFVRVMGEWNLPPYVFESAGTPSLYLNWLRPSVFVAGLWGDPGNASLRKEYASVGGQLDLRFSMLHWYDMTLSVGYAVGYQGSQRAGYRVDDLAQDHVDMSERGEAQARRARPRAIVAADSQSVSLPRAIHGGRRERNAAWLTWFCPRSWACCRWRASSRRCSISTATSS